MPQNLLELLATVSIKGKRTGIHGKQSKFTWNVFLALLPRNMSISSAPEDESVSVLKSEPSWKLSTMESKQSSGLPQFCSSGVPGHKISSCSAEVDGPAWTVEFSSSWMVSCLAKSNFKQSFDEIELTTSESPVNDLVGVLDAVKVRAIFGVLQWDSAIENSLGISRPSKLVFRFLFRPY